MFTLQRGENMYEGIMYLQGVCWQSAKAKMKNRHFTGGYRGSKPFFLTLQTGRKFPLGTEENIICIFDSSVGYLSAYFINELEASLLI